MTEMALAEKPGVADRLMQFAEKVLYRLGLRTPPRLKAAVSEFVSVNSRYWPAVDVRSRGHVLVEGHLAEYGPNYLFRTAVAAKALQEAVGVEVTVLFNGFAGRWTSAKRAYRSFRITRFIFLGSHFLLTDPLRRVRGLWKAIRLTRGFRVPEDILVVEFGGIRVGDLIYDDILKQNGLRTIEQIDRRALRAIARAYFFYLQYEAIFTERPYLFYVSTHSAYSEYGILCRVALKHGVKVIETTDIQMSAYRDISKSTYHDGMREAILGNLEGSNDELLLEQAASSLRKRLNAQIKQLDAQKAFRGHLYTRAALTESLGVPATRKIAFILAHVFCDSPHISSRMLYADYFRWLAGTLAICATIPTVTWIVKPHPSSDLYGEMGAVEKMIADLQAPNVHLCPADLNTGSLEQCADALITVHGTAGLEFSGVGVPVVLAGRPFYSGFGFTMDPESLGEYEAILRGLDAISPLSVEQRRLALQVFGVWERLFDWQNPIVTSEVLANVWGSEQPRNLEAAYDIITRNLRDRDPRRIRLWNFAKSVASAS